MDKQPTDFQSILTELREWGINDYELERRTGVERSKFTKLRTGAKKQPYYDDGCLIVNIWAKEKKKQNKMATS